MKIKNRSDRPYFDVHCHIGWTVSRSPIVGQTAEKCLARFADSNVFAAIPCPTAGGPQSKGVLDTHAQDREIADAVKNYSDRFPIGLAIVEVRHQQSGVDELERSMIEDQLVGFVCHPGLSGHSLGGELHPFLEIVDHANGLCLLHQAGSTRNIANYARKFKNTTFIIGHVSMNKTGHYDAIEHCGPCENVWFDIAQKPDGADQSWDIAHLVDRLGGDRLMFGSDLPYYDFRLVQDQIELSKIDEKTKDLIAFENATRLVQKFRSDWQFPKSAISPPQNFSEDQLWSANGARLK